MTSSLFTKSLVLGLSLFLVTACGKKPHTIHAPASVTEDRYPQAYPKGAGEAQRLQQKKASADTDVAQ